MKGMELQHPTAELTVLAGLLGADTALAVRLAEAVDPLDFSTPTGQVLCEAAQRTLRGVEPMDAPNLLAACRDIERERKITTQIGESALRELRDADAARAEAYAVTVKRFAWLRRAREFAGWFGREVEEIGDPDELFTAAQERMRWLTPASRAATFVYGWDTVAEHDLLLTERMRAFRRGDALRFDWPWESWNRFVRPLRPGLVGVIAAPDSMGKSTFLEMIAEHWAGKAAHVVFVHCENDFDYTCNRRLTRWSRVPIGAIEDGDLSQEQYAAVRGAYERMTFAPCLHYLDASGWTMVELVGELTSRRREGVCQAVVVDYLNKIRPSRSQLKLFAGHPFDRQADDMEQLKSWAQKNGAPVMTAVQMTKEAQQGGRQTRAKIRGSGEVSEKAQLVVVLTRDILSSDVVAGGEVIAHAGEYSPTVKVRVDKQNRGRTGEFEQVYLGRFFEARDAHLGCGA